MTPYDDVISPSHKSCVIVRDHNTAMDGMATEAGGPGSELKTETALAALNNDNTKQFCDYISTGTATIVTKSEKMKKIVEQAHDVLKFRPACPTAEQAKLWTPIEASVEQTTVGFFRLTRLQCQVMRALTLMGDAAGLAVKRRSAGVSQQTAMEPFRKQVAEYSKIAATFDTESGLFVKTMGEIIGKIVHALPGIESSQKVLAEFEKAPQLLKEMQLAQAELLKAHRGYTLKIAQQEADYEQKRVSVHALGQVMMAKQHLYAGAVENVKQAAQFNLEAHIRLATAETKTATADHMTKFWIWSHSWTTRGADKIAMEQASREAKAAQDLEKCQTDNENNAQEAQIQASRLLGDAVAARDQAWGVLTSTRAEANLEIRGLVTKFNETKQAYDKAMGDLMDLVRSTGVHQQHVVTFLAQAMEVKGGAIDSAQSATAITDKIILLDQLLQQRFETNVVHPLTAVADTHSAIKLRGTKLLPFEQMIVEEFGITDKSCCGFDQDDTAEMIERLGKHASESKQKWDIAAKNQFKMLCSGALFAPNEAEIERYNQDVNDREISARLMMGDLSTIGGYMATRCAEVNKQLAACMEISSTNKLLK